MYKDTQLIAFLKNAPGELAKLCEVLKSRQINILAMSIQDAEDYLRGLFKAREITAGGSPLQPTTARSSRTPRIIRSYGS
jgi:hypothetical protein